jgi:glycosyltransferase involved in cell wall biosynthesis
MSGRQLRILTLVHWLIGYGGLHENVLDVSAAFAKRGHRVTVMHPPSPIDARLRGAGCVSITDELNDVSRALALAEREELFDLIYAHPGPARVVAREIARKTSAPLFLTIHGQYPDGLPEYWQEVERVVAVSEAIRPYLASLGVPEERIIVCPNCVDFDAFAPLPNVTPGANTVLITSRIDPDKHVLLEVLRDCVDEITRRGSPFSNGPVRWRVAGDGFYGDAADQLFAEIKLKARPDQQTFEPTGWINDRAALNRAFQAASIVIASGRAAAESIAAGRPTIAVASRGYEGLIREANLDAALSRNLGGVAAPQSAYTPGALYAHLRAAQTAPNPTPLIARLRAERSLAQVDAHVHEVEALLAARQTRSKAPTG